MKRLAFALTILLAGCGKPQPPPPAPPPAPVPAETPAAKPEKREPKKPEKPEKLPLSEDARNRLFEQLETTKDPKQKARLQEQLGITPEPPRPLEPRPAPPPRPQVCITVNGTDIPEVPAGFPMLIELTVHAPSSGPMKLEAPSGRWSDLLKIEFPEGWKPKPILEASGALAMDAASYGRLAWVVSPEESEARPRGEVELRATLNESRAVARVKLTPKKPVAGIGVVERALLFAQYHLALSDRAAGLREVDEALKRQAQHPALLAMRAELLLADGRKAEAIKALDEAIASADRLKQPTRMLLVRRRSLEELK